MAADNRDWHRSWWRKKTGYLERAAFRVSEGERQEQQRRAAWRAVFAKLAVFVLLVVVFVAVKKA